MAVLLCLAASVAVAGEVVVNGDFETGDFGPSWVHGAYRKKTQNPGLGDNVVMPDLPYAGNYSALLGFKYSGQGNAAAYMYQDVTIPSDVSQATLAFKYRMQGYDGDFYAAFTVDIRSTDDSVLENVLLSLQLHRIPTAEAMDMAHGSKQRAAKILGTILMITLY